ncbi:MAG: hypothetical protein HYX97_06035 [Chloroflexi bacterium]|nr:hypothetical protein [Chloroflexota bacterium]
MSRLGAKTSQELRRMLAPGLNKAYSEFRRALEEDGEIEVPLREMMRLKCAQLNNCVH